MLREKRQARRHVNKVHERLEICIMKEKSTFRRLTDKLYGGIDLTWSGIILYALGTAVLTTVFLVLPVFKDSSFARMGETLEAWIFFAVIIIANAKKPLESALKTFVFFLISQPLIYLFQVPFTFQGWGIFRYYPHWFMLTLGTFPAAYIGWYIKKRNWLSLLILMPVLVLLAVICQDGFKHVIHEFPRLLIMVLFCIGQILLYVYVFTEKIWQRTAGLILPVLIVAVMLLMPKDVDFSSSQFLPDNPVLTQEASAASEDTGVAEISVIGTGEDSTILVHVHAYGSTSFTIRDGDRKYLYDIHIYEDDMGVSQIDITPRKD
jgi:hypothetical protein